MRIFITIMAIILSCPLMGHDSEEPHHDEEINHDEARALGFVIEKRILELIVTGRKATDRTDRKATPELVVSLKVTFPLI